MSRDSESKFQVHLSSTKAMFQYMKNGLYNSEMFQGILYWKHSRLFFQIDVNRSWAMESSVSNQTHVVRKRPIEKLENS